MRIECKWKGTRLLTRICVGESINPRKIRHLLDESQRPSQRPEPAPRASAPSPNRRCDKRNGSFRPGNGETADEQRSMALRKLNAGTRARRNWLIDEGLAHRGRMSPSMKNRLPESSSLLHAPPTTEGPGRVCFDENDLNELSEEENVKREIFYS